MGRQATERTRSHPQQKEFGTAAVLLVAGSVGLTSMSFNVWYPFMPLYALKLGATSDANALFWVFIATSSQGIARLVTGPVWGVLSDRFGRKTMFLRALFLSAFTGSTAALVSAPWQLAVTLSLSGALSGLIAPAVALVSVGVPEARLARSLSIVTGAQYMGTTLGPALGAVLAILVGFRGAILIASIAPLVAGFLVVYFVPADVIERRRDVEGKESGAQLEPFQMTRQLWLVIFLYFMVFALNQLLRLATPAALSDIHGRTDVEGEAGIVFSLGGLISAVSVLFLAPRVFTPGGLKLRMALACGVAAVGFVLLSVAGATFSYVIGFLLVAMVLSAMVPTTNTLIAGNTSRARRGTAFGVAGSAQALAFIIGPAGAAAFAAFSLGYGFLLISLLMIGLGLLLFLQLREPAPSHEVSKLS